MSYYALRFVSLGKGVPRWASAVETRRKSWNRKTRSYREKVSRRWRYGQRVWDAYPFETPGKARQVLKLAKIFRQWASNIDPYWRWQVVHVKPIDVTIARKRRRRYQIVVVEGHDVNPLAAIAMAGNSTDS